MLKVFLVFGATGDQGKSIIDYVLKDATLSKEYSIRAATRDPLSSAGQALRQKEIEVIKIDWTDTASLQAAMKGAHTVFMTAHPGDASEKNADIALGKSIADAAVTGEVQYLIYSSLPDVAKTSGGKYTKVSAFDCKAAIADHIRTLPIKSAFYAPGFFMQNYLEIMQPHPAGDGTFVIARPMSPQAMVPLLDVVEDTGKWIGAILAEPDKYEGKTFCAATALYTMEEQAAIMSRVSGKTVRYVELPVKAFRAALPFNAGLVDMMTEMMLYYQDFGYYGPESEWSVAWAAENARGKTTTFEDFLTKNPVPALK